MNEILYYVAAIWIIFGTIRALLILSVSHRAYALTVHNIEKNSGTPFSTSETILYAVMFFVIAPVVTFLRWPLDLKEAGWRFFRPPTDEEIHRELGCPHG